VELPHVAELAGRATVSGRRWTLRLGPEAARDAVSVVTTGAAFEALDDFSLATPSLEDVYLALGGSAEGLVKV
ncbi:MAG TPA: ABC transporter ATP-binding protein, partial [Streptomyces sp.]|nr:ABC transporter ATP-binding protein [Streptomyces sp.]